MASEVKRIQAWLRGVEKPRGAYKEVQESKLYTLIRDHAKNYLLWRERRGYAPMIASDIMKRGFDDFVQEIALRLLEGDPWEVGVRKAFRSTARVYGWRLTQKGWIRESSIPAILLGDEDNDDE